MGQNKKEKEKDLAYEFTEYVSKTYDNIKGTGYSAVIYLALFTAAIPGLWIALASFLKRFLANRNIKTFFVRPKERLKVPELFSSPKFGEKRYIQTKSAKIHYVTKGNKENKLLLLIHGFPDFWLSWREQINYYSENYHVVAVDLKGHGDSEKPVGVSHYKLEEVTNEIKYIIKEFGNDEPAILIGHGIGALIIYKLLLKRSDLIEKYITINSPPQYAFKPNLEQLFKSWYVYFFQYPLLPEIYLSVNDISLGGLNDIYSGAEQDVIDAYKFMLARPGIFTSMINYYRANIKEIASSVIFSDPKLKEIDNLPPGLAIYGGKSKYTAKKSFDYITKVPNLTAKEIVDGGYYVHQQKPKSVNDLIDQFLNNDQEVTESFKFPIDPSKKPEEKPLTLSELSKPKPVEPKPEESKPAESKPKELKPEELKPTEPKPKEPKPEESKPAESKPKEPKPEELKPKEPKPEELKPKEPKPAELKPKELKPAELKPKELKPEELKPKELKPEELKPKESKFEGSKPAGTKPEDIKPEKAGAI